MNNISKQQSIAPATVDSLKRKRSDFIEPPARKIVRIVSTQVSNAPRTDAKPQDCLNSILLSSYGLQARTFQSDDLPGFFQEVHENDLKAYDSDALNAIRTSDMETLREFLRQGRPLKCSNQFGESLLHLACRKGLVQVVKFLLVEAGVPANVRDDMGRSPLHDAFWTPSPNFELVDVILQQCPDLLLICDKRGHPPLAYTRKDHWKVWNQYLQSRQHLLKPTILMGKGSTTIR